MVYQTGPHAPAYLFTDRQLADMNLSPKGLARLAAGVKIRQPNNGGGTDEDKRLRSPKEFREVWAETVRMVNGAVTKA